MPSSIVVALVLLVVLGTIAGAFAWQERARLPERSIVYGAEDAVAWVTARLSDGAAAEVGERDVRRILEWAVQYIQQQVLADETGVVVAGYEAAHHAQRRLHELGFTYRGEVVVEVMELQARYLQTIGAVADPAGADEIDEIFPED